MNGGRVRKTLNPGLTHIIDNQLEDLFLDVLTFKAGEKLTVNLRDRDYAAVLIKGKAGCQLDNRYECEFDRRPDPFSYPPSALLFPGSGILTVTAGEPSLIALASAPRAEPCPIQLISPNDVRENVRGKENWSRKVRLVCWSDNATAGQLMVGETVTPSGNWSTIPPHRHAHFVKKDGEVLEVPYREVYFYQFSQPTGFGMNRQFDEDGTDKAYSLITGDAVFIDGGYHPVVCAPGAEMYQLTLMSGKYRQSTASVHPDFIHLLNSDENPFSKQELKTGRRNQT